jgi:hypothetical protein
VIPRADLESALKKKGFTLETGKDHRVYRVYRDGKKTSIATKISLGTGYKDYSTSLVAMVAKQMRITAGELREFVECTMSAAQYAERIAKES